MGHKSIRLGMLALALAVSAGAAAQKSAPSPATAFPQDNASAQTDARPTPAELDQLGAVVIAPPILRNAGKTVVSPDQALLGRPSLQGQTPQGPLSEQAPAMQPAATEAAISNGGANAGAPGQAHD